MTDALEFGIFALMKFIINLRNKNEGTYAQVEVEANNEREARIEASEPHLQIVSCKAVDAPIAQGGYSTSQYVEGARPAGFDEDASYEARCEAQGYNPYARSNADMRFA